MNATFEVAQADSCRFWFHASEKRRSTRFRVHQKTPLAPEPSLARQQAHGLKCVIRRWVILPKQLVSASKSNSARAETAMESFVVEVMDLSFGRRQ
jgi:hypothetical protein